MNNCGTFGTTGGA